MSAYPAGVEIFVTARIGPSADHPEAHLPGGPRDLAASRRSFRFGLRFSDGGKVMGRPGRRPDRDSEPTASAPGRQAPWVRASREPDGTARTRRLDQGALLPRRAPHSTPAMPAGPRSVAGSVNAWRAIRRAVTPLQVFPELRLASRCRRGWCGRLGM